MKTYLFPEVLADLKTDEWVPANIARELFEALVQIKSQLVIQGDSEYGLFHLADKAIKNACKK